MTLPKRKVTMKKNKKVKKVKQRDVGRFVRVAFADVGAVDGVITEVSGPDDFHFLQLSDGDVIHNNAAPAIALGNRLTAELSGL